MEKEEATAASGSVPKAEGLNFNKLDWLPKNVAYIEVDSEKVKIIETPEEFYRKCMILIREAHERIVISTLYLGNSDHEEALVSELEKTMSRNPNIKMSILLDYLRGTRGEAEGNSATMLKKLVPRASVYLFHTPYLRGLKRMILPNRVNEVVGLQHMKFLVFDNHVIITGANLSETYFTDRQDRYILIEDCSKLADFVDSLIEAVGSCSFKLDKGGTTKLANSCNVHPFEGNLNAYKSMLYSRVISVLQTLRESQPLTDLGTNTRIFPLVQMGIVSINQEFEFLENLLSKQTNELSLTMSSGYLNFTDFYTNLINRSPYTMDIIYASPQANGFHQATGLSRFIPLMYVYISKIFFQTSRPKVHLFEYYRPGWSYHAKGLWIDCKQSAFTATIIGSSNFGYRSVYRDLEAQFLIITNNDELMRKLSEERLRVLSHTTKVDAATFQRSDHFVPFWIRILSRIVRNYF